MAERSIVVCDVCGAPAETTVAIKAEGKSVHKDVCSDHLGELLRGSRPARPGRRRSVGSAPTRASARAGARRGVSKRAAAKKSTAKGAPRRARRPRRAAGTTEEPARAGGEGAA